MLNIEERLNKIERIIKEKDFLENKGLGNEVGYYVFDYSPKDELFVRNHIAFLKNKINGSSTGAKIIEYDLYNLMIEILDKEGYMETCIETEKENGYLDMAENIVDTLGLDYIVSNLPDNCETEITLKVKKENEKYGISSYKYKKELSDKITNVRVFDKDGKEINLFE
jgi:hypothetical protein